MSTTQVSDESKMRSQSIDRALEADAKRRRKECKILLLGMFDFVGCSYIVVIQKAQLLTKSQVPGKVGNRRL